MQFDEQRVREHLEGDLYSDALDSAVTAYCTQGYLNRREAGNGEDHIRRQLAAAIRAWLMNTPETGLHRLARQAAPSRDGARPGDEPVAVGPQAAGRFISTPQL